MSQSDNIFLSGSLPALFAKTAAPIIVIMLANGLFTIVDAYFLGAFVGAKALTAVTLMFPLYMILVALSTLVANGFSSIYARLLGAGEINKASHVFGQAVQLSLLVCTFLIVGFWLAGDRAALSLSNGDPALGTLGYTYISILIYGAPLMFYLAINYGSLRCEGRIKAMTRIILLSAALNVAFDYLFVAEFGWGVAGSAWGTLLSQACSLVVLIIYRHRNGKSRMMLAQQSGWSNWGELLALGIPTSLGYVGISLSAGLTIYCLQLWAGNAYQDIAGAFGILTRLMTFAFLPLLGLSLAFQTIVGNNYGAKFFDRTNNSIKLVLVSAFVYCLLVQTIYILARHHIGPIFVDDTAIHAEIARILPYMVLLMFLFGPLMMIGTYFQAIGDAPRAGLLGLSRTYLFALPLTFALPFWIGEWGIWYAGIVAEILVLGLTIYVLFRRRNSTQQTWGLFERTT